jgi:hypothetical protein
LNYAKRFDDKSNLILGSVLDMPFNDEIYDAIFCHNLLHLLLESQRNKFIEKCYNQLKMAGFAFFTVFSELEPSFGKGTKIEDNTYESKPYRPTHYFTDEDIEQHFHAFSIIETGIIEEKENHGELGLHTHKLRYVFVKKV